MLSGIEAWGTDSGNWGSGITLVKVGNVVTIYVNITIRSNVAPFTTISWTPPYYAPHYSTMFNLQQRNGSTVYLDINPDGSIRITDCGMPSNIWAIGYVTYVIK